MLCVVAVKSFIPLHVRHACDGVAQFVGLLQICAVLSLLDLAVCNVAEFCIAI